MTSTASRRSAALSRLRCETEIDRILDRRQSLRAGPPYAPVGLDALMAGARSLIRAHIGDGFEITAARWLSGGASKLQAAFDLTWDRPGHGRVTEPMVLRMEPAESLVETSRLREFELVQKLSGRLPLPRACWVDVEGEHLPHPAAIYSFVAGVTKPADSVERVSGMGLNFGPKYREVLAEQFIRHLATLHTIPPETLGLTSFDLPTSFAEAALLQINWWERVWEEDYNLDVPLVRIATSWMRENLPAGDHLSVVHGDFRNGNFLFDPKSGEITAWLDWEMAYIGDRHGDLAYTLQRSYGHFAEDGKTYLVCGLTSREDFIRRYEDATGWPVIPATMKFYEVLNLLKCAAIVRGTAPRVVAGGKSHQDVVVAWAGSISYLLMEELRRTLDEVI